MTPADGPADAVTTARQPDRLERVILVYLLLPLLIFWVTWLRWPAALVLLLLTLLSTVPVLRAPRPTEPLGLTRPQALCLIGVAAAWVGMSGLAGGLRLNNDWIVRLAVLQDLTNEAWPVAYRTEPGDPSLLRFPMGYYLVPALVGKLTSASIARPALAVWTVLGLALLFAQWLRAPAGRSWRQLLVMLGVVLCFSGLDIVGWWLDCGCWPAYGQHIEWWSPWIHQYSSQTTLLFWVPNHALPGWLLAAVAWRHRDRGLSLAAAAALLSAAAFWSPLACVGAAPLLLIATRARMPAAAWWREALQARVWAALPVAGVLAAFFTFGQPLPSLGGQALQSDVVSTAAPLYGLILFAGLEWGLLALALLAAAGGPRHLHPMVWAAIVILAVLPLFEFGPGNDIVMRGGIAPMTLLMILAAHTLAERQASRTWRAVIAALLLLGSVTPLTELQRSTWPGPNLSEDRRSLTERVGTPWHYVGTLRAGWMASLLRDPPPDAVHR